MVHCWLGIELGRSVTMKESDIRPANFFQKYLELSAEDAVTYFGSSIREALPCPACGSKLIKPAFEKWDFGYVLCETCCTLYQSPRPSSEDFARFYQKSPSARYWAKTFFPSVADARRKHLFRPKVEEISQLCQRDSFTPKILADIGSGHGLFLEEWHRSFPETKLIAIEPNPDLAQICRSKNLYVVERFVEQAKDLHGKVDLVVALEVIEHVPDPLAFCSSLRQLLREGGRALITGLTVDGFDIQVLWEHSKSISPPHHINFMSILGFEHLLTRAGFSNTRIFTPGKLDVDIVKNTMKENPDVLKGNRFIHHMLEQGEEVLQAFQKYLSEHHLSSHCWIWSTK